jgi:hypothetical protein
VPLTQFAPLADETEVGTILSASNLIPSDRGWRSAYALADAGMATLTATCVGSALVQLTTGSFLMFAGTTGKLWARSTADWADVSATGTTYAATSDQRWHFTSMGDFVLAGNISDTIQVSNAGATFSAITGAPKAALIESVNGFIFAANTIDAGFGTSPDRWWCSGLFDHTDWTPAAATQCTSGRLVDTPGPIRALRRLGQNIVAYKDASLYLGQYVDPPTVWQWTLISSDVGCASHDAVVNVGQAHLFPGPRNFFSYDGAQLQPIGEAIAEWFFDSKLLRSYDNRIQAVHDGRRALVYWFYPPANGSGALTEAVVYHYRTGRWGVATYGIESAVDYVASGITYDGLGTYYTTYDAGIDRTYDSPLWIPDTTSPAVFDATHKLKTIDGAGMDASFTTWHFGDDQRFTLLRRARIRWLDDPTTASLALYTRDEHGGAFVPRATAVQASNKFDVLASARWHKATISTTGTCELTGIQVDAEPQGDW